MTDEAAGTQLLDQGWGQGCLLPSVGHAYFELDGDGNWQIRLEEALNCQERWVVISQDCDIDSSLEPYIEVMPCTWNAKGSSQFNGANRGNSSRHFLVARQVDDDGKEQALIASATKIVQVKKESLLSLEPEWLCDPGEKPTYIKRLAAWLGGRYSRPAMDQSVVDAVQKPIIAAVGALKGGTPAFAAGVLVREIRMFPVEGPGPYVVDLVVLLEYNVDAADERIAAFIGTVEDAVNSTAGETRIGNIAAYTAEEMYVSEYEKTIKIALDHYTLKGQDIHGAEPVRGIDHG